MKNSIKKTKIVCTIGPASWDYETLKKLAEAGMDVARLNFSHGSYEEKAEQINLVRRISDEIGKPLAVMADLQGPKLRLGKMEGTREIKTGDQLEIAVEATGDQLPIQFDLTPFIKVGERMFLNDGLVELAVTAVNDKFISAEAINDGVVSSNKGVNVPDTDLKGRGFTEKDFRDADFAIDAGVDYLALSYVQTPNDIQIVKDILEKKKSDTKIVAKIEMMQALENLEKITELSDAMMVARGDMAIETKASWVPIYQQQIIRTARQLQKPVIVATQMLESMIENPRPTRAEVSDVGNAVFDQADAVMLSAESAQGKYPVESVQTMAEVINSVEQHPDYTNYIKINWEQLLTENVGFSAIAAAAASIAYRTQAKAIIVSTGSGRTARMLSSFRPTTSTIIYVTYDKKVQQQLSLVWGTTTLLLEPKNDFFEFIKATFAEAKAKGLVEAGDKVVLVTSDAPGTTGSTDTIKLLSVYE